MSDTSIPLPKSSLDPAWTQMLISSMGPNVSPRLREVLGSVIKHVHEFTKETKLTVDEWQAGMKFVIETGQASTPLVNELQIVLDCIGMET
jgi:catechol 1,2-dioxygenase